MRSFIQSYCLLFIICLFSCLAPKEKSAPKIIDAISLQISGNTNDQGVNIKDRFIPPTGYKRKTNDSSSFEYFLRHLNLKFHDSKVMYYDGTIKSNPIYAAVVDLPIGKKDLHQCADAIIRLRADYLRSIGALDKISFNFTNGMSVPYSKWKDGNRIKVNGNQTKWVESREPSNSDENFWSYLETIFMYAGTLSLSKELTTKPLQEMSTGDVFIQGGSPGHAVIVVDMVEDDKGRKLFMLAQSYMPAQEIHILKNTNNAAISPWYELDAITNELSTPEWTFRREDLKQF